MEQDKTCGKSENLFRWILIALIILIFFDAVLLFFNPPQERVTQGSVLRVEILTEEQESLQVFYDRNIDESLSSWGKAEASGEFQFVDISIPYDSPDYMRLDTGINGRPVWLRSITFLCPEGTYSFSPTEIKNIFSVAFNIQSLTLESNALKVVPTEGSTDPYIICEYFSFVYEGLTAYKNNNVYFYILFGLLLAVLITAAGHMITSHRPKPHAVILAVIFLLVIFLPGGGMLLGVGPGANFENRELAERPTLSFDLASYLNFPKAYENYFNDHYAFRNFIIKVNSVLNVRLFHESTSDKVLIGKNGWMYYTPDLLIEDFEGKVPHSEEELAAICAEFEYRKNYCEQRGIAYVVFVAPNKNTIYPEFMPRGYQQAETKRFDQVMEYMQNHSELQIIDMREQFLAEKAERLLYYKTDSHWNDYGAFLGYQRLMTAANDSLADLGVKTKAIKNIQDFTLSERRGNGGDLAFMMNLETVIKDDYIDFIPNDFHYKAKQTQSPYGGNHEEYNTYNITLPNAVIFRDSFFNAMEQNVAEHFNKTTYYWSHQFDTKIIEENQPAIVIDEFVERYVATTYM